MVNQDWDQTYLSLTINVSELNTPIKRDFQIGSQNKTQLPGTRLLHTKWEKLKNLTSLCQPSPAVFSVTKYQDVCHPGEAPGKRKEREGKGRGRGRKRGGEAVGICPVPYAPSPHITVSSNSIYKARFCDSCFYREGTGSSELLKNLLYIK